MIFNTYIDGFNLAILYFTDLTNHSSQTLQAIAVTPMTFSPEEDIDLAFSRLSASVKSNIKDVNFSTLQTAAIKRAKSPKMIQKSSEIVPTIKAATSFQDLCALLTDTPYWNFLDNRMMEAMAAASLIPAAQHSVENFKRTFFGMTLAEAVPYFPIIPQKSAHTAMIEQLDKDPSKMTIFELHKHRFYLETELLQTGPDTITIYRIVIGSVTITWQIHVDHVYKAYCSLKKEQSQLPPQGTVSWLCQSMKQRKSNINQFLYLKDFSGSHMILQVSLITCFIIRCPIYLSETNIKTGVNLFDISQSLMFT